MIGGHEPKAYTWRIIIDLSNSPPTRHKLLIRDGENEMQRKAHHHPSNLVD